MTKDNWDKAQIIGGITGTIVMPIVIVIVAHLFSSKQNEALRIDKELQLEQKYLDIVYNDIVSDDSARRRLAVFTLIQKSNDLGKDLFRFFGAISPSKSLDSLAIIDEMENSTVLYDRKTINDFKAVAEKLRQKILNRFKIEAYRKKDSESNIIINGQTPFLDKKHYLIVKPYKENAVIVVKISITSSGYFNIAYELTEKKKGHYEIEVIILDDDLDEEQMKTYPQRAIADAISSNSENIKLQSTNQ